MSILFATGIAVSALLLASGSNPDTSGGVTMQKADVGDGHPNNALFPDGSCNRFRPSFSETSNTGCGWINVHERSYYINPE